MKSVACPIVLLALLAVGETAATGAADGSEHPFSVHDMVTMERLGSPQPSPDGRWIVFTRRTYDWESDRTATNLWVVSIEGGQPRRLTASRAHDTGPRWSPDGKTIAFISNRGGSSQIWTIAPGGGEATQRTDLPVDVGNVQWSPDGARFAFTAEVYPDCPDLECTAERDRERDANPVTARVFTRLPFRHWDTWEDDKRSHVMVLPIDSDGKPIDLMKGLDADSPTKPFGGGEEFTWSPDGVEVAFTAKVVESPAWSTDLDVYIAATDGSGFRCITEANEAVDTQPAYSPDGRTIAYLAMMRPGYESDRRRVVLHDRATGRKRVVTESWDRSPESVVWSPDGSRLLVTAAEMGRKKIFGIDLRGDPGDDEYGRVHEVVGEHYNSGLAVGAADRIVFGQDSLTSPVEIYTSRLDGSDLRQLTHINDERLALARMSRPEELWFDGAGGASVHGWLLKPVDYRPGRRYPIAFMVHGGPQGSWSDHFHYRWNPQAYAGAGYVVVAINFHGSTGYGQAFTDDIRQDWGGKPFKDLMRGLDHVISAYDFADGDRVCALGASYGGYMINWIAGQTQRFKCLVNHDGEFDVRTSYYTTEELWFPEWEFGGPPWESPRVYQRWSPSEHVARWNTPMLVIHGALDFRLPETEGFATFTALQRRGIPSKLVYFPTENHWVLSARNSVFWHETVIGWLDEWLMK